MTALGSAQLMAFAGATDLDCAREFYEGVLGLELEQQDSFACQFRSGDTRLRVTRVDEVGPAAYTVLGWLVPDIEAAIHELAGRGVGFERYEGVRQDELGAWSAPSGARVAWFRDPDGNTLSLTEMP
jgi:catechol 2,3-dioxygenase-like lactoylglutathione lyase family enzyme